MDARKINGIFYIAGKWPLDQARSTIVFIHGAAGSCVFWEAQIKGLAARTNTVAIDLPGHGRSDGPGEDKVEGYTRAVKEFTEAIESPRILLCGISMGGAIVMQLLIDYRKRFRAGILISTGARLTVAPALFETIQNDYDAFVKMLAKFAASSKSNPKVSQLFQQHLAMSNSKVALGDFRACDDFNVVGKLSSIEVPALIVTAEDDKLTPPKYGEFLEKEIKNVRRTHIRAAGHIVPMEKPDDVNKAIVDFLDEAGL